MTPETKLCQNCKGQFTIEPEDFGFYEKIKVPPPTWCPWCRFIRRMSWRNERALYKRTCDLCGKNMMSMYRADAPFPVYCRECWYGDGWDPSSYAREYDPAKTFFSQYAELLRVTPKLALWQRNVTNSEYSNMVGECRNVYLSTSTVANSENVFYSKSVDSSFNIFDSYGMTGSDGCYENIEGEKNYNSHYLTLSRNCIDSRFLIDCANCRNCFMSSNLRNKEFYFRNKAYSKEEYLNELAKLELGSREKNRALLAEFEELRRKAFYKFANILRSTASTGNNLINVKNCTECFDVYDAENSRYCYRGFRYKEGVDFDFGQDAELMYEYSTGALNDYNVHFSFSALGNVRNADYTDYCVSCSDIFGCVSLRNKQFSILNKTYTEEEYRKLRTQIIEQMDKMPYKDLAGLEYRYGEYPPTELSPFAYNETLAYDSQPISAQEARSRGYAWYEPDNKNITLTIKKGEIPDSISPVSEEILTEVLECSDQGNCNHRCLVGFRLTRDEFNFYKKQNIPIPDKCPNCRYYERMSKLPPQKLWDRQCMCRKEGHSHTGQCDIRFETPYAPERPEIVYCENCYNQEIA